ncbi:MAG: AAA family ATPase [Gammaproteobacteria bacterium]|nr:AAA family ATPase [Gammaproteobacteria bacterium]
MDLKPSNADPLDVLQAHGPDELDRRLSELLNVDPQQVADVPPVETYGAEQPAPPAADATADARTLELPRLDELTVGPLLTTPPRRPELVRDLMPMNVVGILGAAGGTGKHGEPPARCSVAAGVPWLGMEIETTGPVLIVSNRGRHETSAIDCTRSGKPLMLMRCG